MNQSVILFDGVCNLCNAWVQFLIRIDKHEIFQFATLQSESGQKLVSLYNIKTGQPEFVVYISNSICLIESDAILEILNDLGGFWKFFIVFKLIPKILRDRIYRFIARKRYKIFGKRASCMIPTPELKKRFLS